MAADFVCWWVSRASAFAVACGRAAVDIYPSLTYRDLEAALEFLEKAFGLEPEELGTDEHGAVRHAVLRHGDGLVLLQPDLRTSCTEVISVRGGFMSPWKIPTPTSSVPRRRGPKFWESLTTLWGARCAATARATSRATFGASAPIGPADDLTRYSDDGVPQMGCVRSLDHLGYL